LLLLPALFGALSCLMISSITGTAAAPYSAAVVVQIAAYIIGYGLLAAAALIDYKRLFKLGNVLGAVSVIIQCLVFVPGLGREINGTLAWIDLGVVTLQPSEFVKVLFVLYFGAYLTRRKDDLQTFAGFLLALAHGLPICALAAYVDMGAGIVLFVMLSCMIFAAGLRTGLVIRLALVFVILVPVVYRFLSPHQKERFAAFLHPDDMSIDAVHQVWQAKVAIGSGGFLGKGYRQGVIKESGLLPVQESDFIFPIICEEFGFVGGAVLLALYTVLIVRIWWTVAKAIEYYGAIICVGFMCMFGFQIFENIGMSMGLMPVTGITLPFISAGGSSVAANMAALGFIIGIHYRDTSRGLKYL
jgi:rod shape determining protein RodA